ncbi:MAG: hypothetical protein JNJ54_23180 [Myxococcaceae bacterium]|nr:hypothetical protein [Myxococcaceae bacterium]
MLTTPLLLVLSAAPVLGEEGESCRTDADCLSSLVCVATTCAVPAVRAEPSIDGKRVEPPAAPATNVTSEAEAVSLFTGVHFVLGVMGGAGPMWSRSTPWLLDAPQEYEAFGVQVPLELRVGALFGHFELMAELAPWSMAIVGVPRRQTSATLSAGWLLTLFERKDFSVSLPFRVRGGGYFGNLKGGLAVGGSIGVALRFGNALVELRGVADCRATTNNLNIAVPVNLSFSWIF